MKKQLSLNLPILLTIALFALNSCKKKDKTSNGNSSSPTKTISLSPYNDTDYPLRMEKMVVFESKDDPTAASTYNNIDFLQRTALITDEKLSDGQTIKKMMIVLSNRESKFKKPGDFKISFTLTNAGEAISSGIYTAQHCNCSKCSELINAPYHLSGTISYYPNEKDILGICSNDTDTQVEIIELTNNEAIGSFNIIDKKTKSRFKGTFTYPLAFL